MKQRSITSFFIVLVVAIAVASKFLPYDIGDYVFDLFILCITVVAAFEMSHLIENCNKKVTKLNYTARDHCPFCLYSKHVDINPGDRQNKCLGLLKPIGIEKYKNTYKIIYKCSKCNELHKNIMAIDDDFDKIIEISNIISS